MHRFRTRLKSRYTKLLRASRNEWILGTSPRMTIGEDAIGMTAQSRTFQHSNANCWPKFPAPAILRRSKVRVSALGKKGRVSELMSKLGSHCRRKSAKASAQTVNILKAQVTDALDARKAALETAALDAD